MGTFGAASSQLGLVRRDSPLHRRPTVAPTSARTVRPRSGPALHRDPRLTGRHRAQPPSAVVGLADRGLVSRGLAGSNAADGRARRLPSRPP